MDRFLKLRVTLAHKKQSLGLNKLGRTANRIYSMSPTNSVFIIGNHTTHNMGFMRFLLPTPVGMKYITADVIILSLPLLLGLDTFDCYQRNILTVQNLLASTKEHCSFPLMRLFGYIFL